MRRAYAVSRLGLWVRAWPAGDVVAVEVQGGGPQGWEPLGAVPLDEAVALWGPGDAGAVAAGIARWAVALVAGWGASPAEPLGWFAPLAARDWLVPGAHGIVEGAAGPLPGGAVVAVADDGTATLGVAGGTYPLDLADPAVLRAILVEARPSVEGGRTGEVEDA
jgi:hypothetical protein